MLRAGGDGGGVLILSNKVSVALPRQGGVRVAHPPVSTRATFRVRFRVKMEHTARFSELSSESHGPDLALTVLHVPCSLDSSSGLSAGSSDRMYSLIGCR